MNTTPLSTYRVVSIDDIPSTSGVYGLSGCYVSDYNPLYIGSSVNMRKRLLHEHFPTLNHGKHYNPFLQRAYNAHKEDFKILIFVECPIAETLAYEQEYLDSYRPFCDEGGGFNVCKQAGKGPGKSAQRSYKHSKESYERVCKANGSERKRSILSNKLKGRPKPPRSAEHRRRHSEALRGRKLSKESVAKREATRRARGYYK